MLLRAYLIMGLLVTLGFSTAALSGWRMFPAIRPGYGMFPGIRGPGGYSVGGGHHSGGGYHSTWHGGK
jgi:hypothetical protein